MQARWPKAAPPKPRSKPRRRAGCVAIGPLGRRIWTAGFEEILRCVGKLGREKGDRLCIDLALVPLLEHREVRAAGLPILAALPAVTGKIVRGRRQTVGRPAPQVSPASSVPVDSKFPL